jgi:lipoate-protein ligase A
LHGTLLFNSDLTKVSASLNADPRKFQDKSVKSIKSRVSNISPFLSKPLTIEEFTSFIISEVISEFPGSTIYELSEFDIKEIEKLADNKYSTWEWVYGNSPKFTYQGELKYEKGILDIGLYVESGLIKQVSIFGDFFGKREVEELTNALKNVNYQRNAVESALVDVNLDEYIFGLSKVAFIDSLFSN